MTKTVKKQMARINGKIRQAKKAGDDEGVEMLKSRRRDLMNKWLDKYYSQLYGVER